MRQKRKIYLAQVDILRKSPSFYTAYLPYAAGVLWSYAKQEPAVGEGYDLKEIFFLRDDIEEVVSGLEDPFLFGFSCYCWNTEYNKALAKAVKQAFPDCAILFGGHNVPPGGGMLEDFSYIDFLIHGEGEIPFRKLLEELCNQTPDFASVPGISYRTGQTTKTNPEAVLESLEDCPSPYLDGIFDPIVEAHPEIQWCTVWETNRGCPHHCVYCDWGQHKAKIRPFAMDRLIAEIDWLSDNKVEYVMCADANFGVLTRDEEILDFVIAARERTEYPKIFFVQNTKTINERVFRMIEKINKYGLDKLGPNLAVQSLTPEVLRNIGRQNIDDESFAYWIRRYRQAGFRTHTDLILALPGESLQSFCACVEKLFVLGQHDGIQYFTCHLLPNAYMATPSFREKYKIRTTRKILKQGMDSLEKTQITEYVDAVHETVDMPHEDWLTANYYMLMIQGAHSYGISRLIAIFLHNQNILPYADFYWRLLDFCHKNTDTLLGDAMAHMEEYFADFDNDKESAELLKIPGLDFGRIWEDQYIFSRTVLEPDRFFAEMSGFLKQFDIDPDLKEQLLAYQRESIILPGEGEKILEFKYDFPAYFNAVYDGESAVLQKKTIRLRFSHDYDISSMEKYFDEIVRRGRFSSNAFYKVEYLPG